MFPPVQNRGSVTSIDQFPTSVASFSVASRRVVKTITELYVIDQIWLQMPYFGMVQKMKLQ